MVIIQRGKSLYAYRSFRRNGKVTSQYLGSGLLTILAMESDDEAREKKTEARERERQRLSELAATEAEVDRYHRGVEAVFRGSMWLAGWHRQDRHKWRRRRMSTELATTGAAAREWTHEEVLTVAERFREGDPAVTAEWLEILKSPKWRGRVLSSIGSPAHHLTMALINTFCDGPRDVYRETMLETSKELVRNLTPPGAGTLERLLARRVTLCWLALCAIEHQAAARQKRSSPRELEAYQRATDRAQRRWLQAVGALKTFHRADPEPPGVVVNVGQAVSVTSTTP